MLEENKINYRLRALFYYYQGQACIDEKDFLLALTQYRYALSYLRWVCEEEVAEQEAVQLNRYIQDTLSALIKALNMLIALSPERFTWTQTIDELEKFLRFYVGSYTVFNKTQQRLPQLNELNLNELGAFLRKASSPSEKGRAEICLAIISLFHEDLQSARTLRALGDDDATVKKVFALYQRALEIVPPPEPEPEPEPVLPPVVVAPPVRIVKPALVPKMPKFDEFAPVEKKRADIVVLIAMKKYSEVVKRSEYIFDRVAADYRLTGECYYEIGNEHFDQDRFQEAIENYKEALLQCKHIMKTDVIDEDQNALSKVFTALIKSLDEITREWEENFVEASKSLANVLDFYLDYFDDFHWKGKKLPGLDEIDMDNMIPFLSEIGDATQQAITKIYLTVIAMFRQDAKLEEGELVLIIDDLKTKKETQGNAQGMMSAFDLFQKALDVVQSTKHRGLLNPELQAAPESDQKRRKKEVGDSSSSSSLPPMYLPPFGLEVRPATPRPGRLDLQTGLRKLP